MRGSDGIGPQQVTEGLSCPAAPCSPQRDPCRALSAALQPLAPSSSALLLASLFLSEGVDVGSRNISDQLAINETQYFSSKKLWRYSGKARISLSFRKPGCRKNPFEITLLLPGLLLPTLWQEATAPESVNLLSLLRQEHPWYKFIALNRAGPLIPSTYL